MEGVLRSGRMEGVLRSQTFFVDTERQRKILGEFHRSEELLAEEYHKNKSLCFNAQGYQKQHPEKAKKKIRDADVTLESPMILGVADGVSQIEDFGIDASMLPKELLRHCEDLGRAQLTPGRPWKDTYLGPIPLLTEAFTSTESQGSTTVVLALLDNGTRIHGKEHPMIAVITVGDCQLLILRRTKGRQSQLETVFQTEMQRIDGHAQTPLQIARIDETIDTEFQEEMTLEVIEKGSAVHCVSAYEGDILIMGSDGVFDNLFCDEVCQLCNHILQPGQEGPVSFDTLRHLAQQIVHAAHRKSTPGQSAPPTPIGRGGKVDDTSVVVAEVVEWTEEHAAQWGDEPRDPMGWLWDSLLQPCAPNCCMADDGEPEAIPDSP